MSNSAESGYILPQFFSYHTNALEDSSHCLLREKVNFLYASAKNSNNKKDIRTKTKNSVRENNKKNPEGAFHF